MTNQNRMKHEFRVTPYVSIFIAAHNEETIIKEKINNALSLNYPSKLLQILVVSDGSTDSTESILTSFKSDQVLVFINNNNIGKNAIINKYISYIKGDIIIFTDSNAMFSNNSIKYLVENFADPMVGCVGGKLQYLQGLTDVAKGEGLYFRYENFIRHLEGLRGNLIGCNGAIYAIKRDLFIPVPNHVPNDFFHPMSVLKRGLYSVFEQRAVAYEKPSESQTEEFKRRKRIVTRSFGAVIEISRQYGFFSGNGLLNLISHKIFRWFGFPIMLLLLLLNLVLLRNPFFLGIFYLQIIFYLFGVFGFFLNKYGYKTKLFYIPFYFLLINFAGVFGLIDYFRGQRTVTWKSAKTTR
jgi:cellulose synthase/poly-beta-1,6-N-acetylglucosamine synthase-like glycosyltransferase